MRILMVSQYYPPYVGGYAIICADTVKVLRDRGHEVRVLTSTDAPAEAERDEAVRRVLRRRSLEGYEQSIWRQALRWPGDALAFRSNARTVVAEARDWSADVAVVWQFDSLGPDLVQSLRREKFPTILNVADPLVSLMKKHIVEGRGLAWGVVRTVFYREFSRDLLRIPINTCSAALRQFYIEAGFDPQVLTVVPIAVWERDIAERPPEGGGTRLLYVGRIHPDKGIEVAIRALAALTRAEPGRFTLDVSGAGAPEYVASLGALARELGVAPAVQFLGPVSREELLRRYDAHDIALVPSIWYEGGGITVLNAMSRGLGVVASNRGGPTSAITHGVNGMLAETGNVEAFAAAVKQLADDPALRRAMGERAIATVRERFTLEGTGPMWEAEFERAKAAAAETRKA